MRLIITVECRFAYASPEGVEFTICGEVFDQKGVQWWGYNQLTRLQVSEFARHLSERFQVPSLTDAMIRAATSLAALVDPICTKRASAFIGE